MAKTLYYELPEFAAILTFIDAIFAELNMGLFIFHMEEPKETGSLKLIYANREASKATGANLHGLVGKQILDAFPSLTDTDVPRIFSEVISRKEPRRIEELEYGDSLMKQAKYRVKAFPMPRDCAGVLFERI
jgi:hypothetical protein